MFSSAVYYKEKSRILILSIPADFKAQGLVVRYLALKMAVRTRVFNFDWQVTIEAFH